MAQLKQQALPLEVERVAKRSTSRVVRRPVGPPVLDMQDGGPWWWGSRDFVLNLAVALDRAGVKPGDSFYVHRVPPPERETHTADLQAAPGSRADQRREILRVASLLPIGATANGLAQVAKIEGGWRRVSELVAGGHLEATGETISPNGRPARVLKITERGRAALRESAP